MTKAAVSRRVALLGLSALALTACAPKPQPAPKSDSQVPLMGVHVHNAYPHSTDAFTQGLQMLDEHTLIESTGLYDKSQLRVVELSTGEVLDSVKLDDADFAEGLTLVDDTVYQLTWKEGRIHTWSLNPIKHTGTLTFEGEGWGLCYDPDRKVLWRSDGTATLTAHRPEDFEPTGQTLTVTVDGREVHEINELEYAQGSIWANVWQTDHILRIDPTTGESTGVVDAGHLRMLAASKGLNTADPDAVLNGIAFHEPTGHMLLTGKNWPAIFEVSFEEMPNTADSAPGS